MRVINLSVSGMPRGSWPLLLGVRGENDVTEVVLDYSAWVESYGAGAMQLFVIRAGDAAAYPVALSDRDGSAVWLVSSVDTNAEGMGKAEFVYRVNEQVAKTCVFKFSVGASIDGPTVEPPDPYETWLEQLAEMAAETQQNAQNAAESASEAEGSAQDAAASATDAEAARGDAQQSAEAAAESAVTAKTAENGAEAARDAALTAKSGAEAARDAAVTAKESAEAAHVAATQSASEAEGYAGDAETAKNAAEEAAEHAEQAASTAGYMFFYIDARGHLIYQRTSNTQVDFYLENGHLYVEAIA